MVLNLYLHQRNNNPKLHGPDLIDFGNGSLNIDNVVLAFI